MNTTLRLEMKRVFKAPRQKVYEAWTRPEIFNKWMHPHDDVVADASMDLRVGGTYRIGMKGSIGDRQINGYASGMYKELVQDERISFTWIWRFEDTGVESEETLVTVTLRDVEGGTEMVLVHDKFLTPEYKQDYEAGWAHCFDTLEKQFAA